MNKNIETLPILNTDDFDSSQDLLLLQKTQVGGVGEPSIFSLTGDLASNQVAIRNASIRFLPQEMHIDKFFYSEGDRNKQEYAQNVFRSQNLTSYGVPSSANHVLLSVVDSTRAGGGAARTFHIRFFYGKYPEALNVNNYLFQDFVRHYTSKQSQDKGYPIMHTDQFWLPVFENTGDDSKKLIYHKANLVNVDLDFYIIAYS